MENSHNARTPVKKENHAKENRKTKSKYKKYGRVLLWYCSYIKEDSIHEIIPSHPHGSPKTKG